jgi:hypothetical protein
MPADGDLVGALQVLTRFLTAAPLTSAIADLEYELEGRHQEELDGVLDARGLSPELLTAALLVRRHVGRVNDLIHAAAIALSLPKLLAPGETLRRPSLAAGNDPSRPFDVETDLRVAEFKFARWDGHDAMRKRHVFKDLVHLAAVESGRAAELYVLGARPVRFLRTTRSSVSWALDRFPATRVLFERRFGSVDKRIPEFVSGDGARVAIIDLEQRLPALFPPG